MKSLLLIIISLFAVVRLSATPPPQPGDYSGAWMGRFEREQGLQGNSVHLNIATNGDVTLTMTFVNPITGGISPHTFTGKVRRNGTIRGRDSQSRFWAVSQWNGYSVRGVWLFPLRNQPPIALRFFANHE